MKAEYGWGSSLYYFQSANLSVHPTYVMELTKDDRYSPSEIVAALDRLNTRGAMSFDIRRLTEAVEGDPLCYPGGAEIADWFTARDVLIIANGHEARVKRRELELFIQQQQPFVIGLNAHLPIEEQLVDAVAVCHPERAVLDATALTKLNCEVIAPRSLLDSISLRVPRLRDIGYRVDSDQMALESQGVVIPFPIVAAYVLTILKFGEAKRVFLAGFDGYGPDDPRHVMMQRSLEQLATLRPQLPVIAITRTTYEVSSKSIFAPH